MALFSAIKVFAKASFTITTAVFFVVVVFQILTLNTEGFFFFQINDVLLNFLFK